MKLKKLINIVKELERIDSKKLLNTIDREQQESSKLERNEKKNGIKITNNEYNKLNKF